MEGCMSGSFWQKSSPFLPALRDRGISLFCLSPSKGGDFWLLNYSSLSLQQNNPWWAKQQHPSTWAVGSCLESWVLSHVYKSWGDSMLCPVVHAALGFECLRSSNTLSNFLPWAPCSEVHRNGQKILQLVTCSSQGFNETDMVSEEAVTINKLAFWTSPDSPWTHTAPGENFCSAPCCTTNHSLSFDLAPASVIPHRFHGPQPSAFRPPFLHDRPTLRARWINLNAGISGVNSNWPSLHTRPVFWEEGTQQDSSWLI